VTLGCLWRDIRHFRFGCSWRDTCRLFAKTADVKASRPGLVHLSASARAYCLDEKPTNRWATLAQAYHQNKLPQILRLTSLNPGNCMNSICNIWSVVASGRPCTNKMRLGGRLAAGPAGPRAYKQSKANHGSHEACTGYQEATAPTPWHSSWGLQRANASTLPGHAPGEHSFNNTERLL